MKVDRIEISGLWGSSPRISTDFFERINVITGGNGSGKTTFVRLLVAVLTADFSVLRQIKFGLIEVWLSNESEKKKISVMRKALAEGGLQFKIDDVLYFSETGQGKVSFQMQRGRNSQELKNLRKALGDLVDVAWLAVQRASEVREFIDDDEDEDDDSSEVDRALRDLLGKFVVFQSGIREKLNRKNREFEESVLLSLLYDEKFDDLQKFTALEFEVGKAKQVIRDAFSVLGIQIDDRRLEIHVQKLKDGLVEFERINKPGSPGVKIEFMNLMLLPLYMRTKHLIDVITNIEKDKTAIRFRIDRFYALLKEFMKSKKVVEDLGSELGLKIEVKPEVFHDVFSLSSGEKQLLIQLLSVLIQDGKQSIYVSDEPELSLHVEWQRRLLGAIAELNDNAQIIVATHSPEIAGSYRKNCLDMEKMRSAG